MKFFEKIKESLKKTRDNISGKISNIINLFTKIDEDFFEELEEILISSDVGMKTSEIICNKLREEVKKSGITDPKEIKNILINIITELLEDNNSKLNINTKPSIILVVGVNGVGKTTSIAKLAYNLQNQDKKVILAAGDTFRAAAVEQLDIRARLIDCPIVKQPEGSDSASVIYDTICSAKAHNSDVIICDTAGRLHNKQNLMRELEKINKIISRELPESNKEILLVLDASTGQNGLNQAIEFKKILNLTGIILTKLDGTARGGIILAIKNQLELPVKYIGLGEDLESLKEFNAREFSEALFSEI